MFPALDYLLASSSSSATGNVLHRDLTLQRTIILAVLDVQMHLAPSLTKMSVPDCTTCASLETRHDGARKKLSVTRLFCGGFNMALWFRVFLTHSSTPITSTALTRPTLGTLLFVCQEEFGS